MFIWCGPFPPLGKGGEGGFSAQIPLNPPLIKGGGDRSSIFKLHPKLNILLTILFCIFSGLVFAEPKFPPLTGRVVDAANMLDAAERQQLESQLAAFERASGIQLVVATLPDLQGYEIEEYSYQLGRAWGIGQRDKNNGVLLIVAQAERKVRIEVGYGLEGTLTDALSSNIINTIIVPQFKTGQFAAGIEQGAQAIMQALRGEYQPRIANNDRQGHLSGMLFWLLLFGVVVIFLGGMGGGGFGGGYGRRGIFYPIGMGGGGFGGGGGFSGGGGSFGGGGASGNW
jgi:uncharacterized protein